MRGEAGVRDAFFHGRAVWLLSDLHANLGALESALGQTNREDPVVFMGDLLTYGPDPGGVVERIQREAEQRPVAVLWGNHDELYSELLRGCQEYYERLPGWLQESVDWTFAHVRQGWFHDELPWCWSIELGGVFLSHANPYERGDWTYLNTRAQHREALDVVRGKGYRVGIFGHTHRAKMLLRTADGSECWWEEPAFAGLHVDSRSFAVVNAGSLGQPRSRTHGAVVASLCRDDTGVWIQHHAINFPFERYRSGIEAASLSHGTKKRLLSFFE